MQQTVAAKDLSVAIDGQPFSTVLLGVPQPTDPGDHVVSATATGFKGNPTNVTLKDAGQAAVVVKMEVDKSVPPPVATPAVHRRPTTGAISVATTPSGAPPPSDNGAGGSSGMRTGAYVGFGVGVVGVVLGTVFVLKSSSNRKSADSATQDLEKTGGVGGGACSIAGGTCDDTSPAAQNVHDFDNKARSAKTIGIVGYVVGGVGVAAGVTLFVLSNKKSDGSTRLSSRLTSGPGALGLRGAFLVLSKTKRVFGLYRRSNRGWRLQTRQSTWRGSDNGHGHARGAVRAARHDGLLRR